MKLSCILTIACLTASARVLPQQVTLHAKGWSLETVFKSIEKQTPFIFFYNASLLDKGKPVTVDLQNVSLSEALDACFRSQPFTYSIEDRTITVQAKEETSVPAVAITAVETGVDIHGHVTDSAGNPLVGASVAIRGTRLGTSTDRDGNFVLNGVRANPTIIISFTGYVTREIRLNNVEFVNIVLARLTSKLDEVQIIAYGQTTKRYNLGDVNTITAKEIEQQPVSNPLLALAGRVPGLVITQATGFSGSGVQVHIQGLNSITNGVDPFYVVDGVPFGASLLPNEGTVLGMGNTASYQASIVDGGNNNTNGSPFNFINPNDIESISVLKDADATAIYGTRAANGAILITTKKGKAGKMRVGLNVQEGYGKVAEKLKLMNTEQYLKMRHTALQLDGLTPSSTDYDINGFWDTTRNTDWQKELLSGTAEFLDCNASVSGGSGNSNYSVGGTFHREKTVFSGNFADTKGALHFNLNSASENQHFHVQLTGSYMLDNNLLPQVDLTAAAMNLAPDAPPIFDGHGNLNWVPTASGTSSFFQNPGGPLINTYLSRSNNLVSNLVLSYTILPGLELRSSFGYTYTNQAETAIQYARSYQPENRSPQSQGSSNLGSNVTYAWIAEPQLSYKANIAKGKLEFLAGSSIQETVVDGYHISVSGFSSEELITSISSASYISAMDNTNSIYKYNGAFGRLNYNWDGKYLIDLTIRRDGSSRFGPANQFHDFGAAGLGWIFSEEKWVKKGLPVLSFGKLRANYGSTGNDQIGNYNFLNLYQAVVLFGGVPYQGINGLMPLFPPNANLQWELTKKLNLGLDLGFFKDRILTGVNYYQNRSSDMFLYYQMPYISGFPGRSLNLPAVIRNSGMEITLSAGIVRKKDFSWTVNVNLTVPMEQGKLLSFPGLDSSTYANSYVVGRSTMVYPAYHYLGVDPATGLYLFSDGKGGTSTAPENDYPQTLTGLISPTAKYYGGLDNSFRYKGLTLDVLLEFKKQTGPTNYFGVSREGNFNTNEPAYMTAYWTKAGDKTPYGPPTSIGNNFSNYLDAMGGSDRYYGDASYIRMKNVSLSWQMPEGWAKRIGLQQVSLFLQGQNLLTATHYVGLDPENQSSTTLPPLRTMTFGARVEL